MSDNTNLFEDFIRLEKFAAQFGRGKRTGKRWTKEPDGLPYVRVGNQDFVHVPTGREWLFGRMRKANPRRDRTPAAA